MSEIIDELMKWKSTKQYLKQLHDLNEARNSLIIKKSIPQITNKIDDMLIHQYNETQKEFVQYIEKFLPIVIMSLLEKKIGGEVK